MGDKKGKKGRAKEHRQAEAKDAKAAKQKQDSQQPLTLGNALVRGTSNSNQGQT